MSSGDVKRSIDSPLRREQAASTRRRIVRAAGQLFGARGYAATSVEDIAAAAGVGRATVFKAVGGKPALLKAAFDVAIAGDDEPVPVAARPQAEVIRAEPDPRVALRVFVDGVAERAARMASIYWAIQEAAGGEPQVRELAEALHAQAVRGSQLLVADLARKGPLRADVDEATAAQILAVHLEPAAYRALVVRGGWSLERFSAWLFDVLAHQLLPPPSDDTLV